MSTILQRVFLILVWAFMTKFMTDYLIDQTATRQLKDNTELATHDATMMLSADELSMGKVVFDRLLAEQVLYLSLEKNLKLSYDGESLTDLESKSFFKNPVKVVHMEFIDDLTNPNLVYPCTYGVSCGDAQYDIFETVKGPAIVVVTETTSPRAFSKNPKTIRQAVVYEYGAFN